jgi:hypothetical protein
VKLAIGFVGGIAVGLLIADQYAKWKASSAATSLLSSIGLGAAAPTIAPIVGGLVG